jgi:hypothetical protein
MHNGVALLLSFRDPLEAYVQRAPFSALNQPGALPVADVIEATSSRVIKWRKDSSCRILQAWDEGGEAWMSTRLLAQRPNPDWDWTERDDSRIHWTDLPAFFNQFQTDGKIGSADGFVRVAPTPENRKALRSSCPSELTGISGLPLNQAVPSH